MNHRLLTPTRLSLPPRQARGGPFEPMERLHFRVEPARTMSHCRRCPQVRVAKQCKMQCPLSSGGFSYHRCVLLLLFLFCLPFFLGAEGVLALFVGFLTARLCVYIYICEYTYNPPKMFYMYIYMGVAKIRADRTAHRFELAVVPWVPWGVVAHGHYTCGYEDAPPIALGAESATRALQRNQGVCSQGCVTNMFLCL